MFLPEPATITSYWTPCAPLSTGCWGILLADYSSNHSTRRGTARGTYWIICQFLCAFWTILRCECYGSLLWAFSGVNAGPLVRHSYALGLRSNPNYHILPFRPRCLALPSITCAPGNALTYALKLGRGTRSPPGRCDDLGRWIPALDETLTTACAPPQRRVDRVRIWVRCCAFVSWPSVRALQWRIAPSV